MARPPVNGANWIDRRIVSESGIIQVLEDSLDRGEAEAIALALELRADLLLMDERLGRHTAGKLGLHVVGVLGILVEAKRKRLLGAIAPLIAKLRDDVGFRLAPELVQRVLDDLGEQPLG